MPSLASIRASNAAFNHVATQPVGVFVGGTSGIGEGMARAFASHTKGNSDIVLVGRNRAAAEAILASLPTPESESTTVAREFVQCDVTLMKNVQTATEEIKSKYPKINYLAVTTGIMTLSGRDETTEGIDKKLAVHYYGRWKFISDLLPNVERAKAAGEDAAVMSVLAPSYGGNIDMEDLAVKKTYSTSNVAMVTPTYNDLMMEAFAEKSPTIPFIHAHPGFVRSGLLSASPSFLLRASSVLVYALRPFSVSVDESGEYMWNAIYSTATKPGAWRTGWHGGDLGKKRYYGNEDQRRKLWEHTYEVVNGAVNS